MVVCVVLSRNERAGKYRIIRNYSKLPKEFTLMPYRQIKFLKRFLHFQSKMIDCIICLKTKFMITIYQLAFLLRAMHLYILIFSFCLAICFVSTGIIYVYRTELIISFVLLYSIMTQGQWAGIDFDRYSYQVGPF